MLDSLVLLALIIIILNILSVFQSVSDAVRISVFIFVFILYDPMMTSSFGGTFGHMIIGIRVKRINSQEKNILFPSALFRFILKALLGWISLLTVTNNEHNRAIHDTLAGSIVVFK